MNIGELRDMSDQTLTDWVKSNLNYCFTAIRENKSNYVRLETLIQIELLYEMIRTFHLEIEVPNMDFQKKVLSLIRTKRHFFQVSLDKEYLKKEFDFTKK